MRSQQWLLELKGHIIRSTTEAARAYWPSPNELGSPYFNFRLEHIRQGRARCYTYSQLRKRRRRDSHGRYLDT